MTSRALQLLATNKWIRPLNATLALPSPSVLVRLEPYSFLPARRTLVTSTWLQNSLSDEDEVILLVGTTKNESRMRYKELLEKAGDRNLVRVKTTKIAESVPRFRIMSDVDLEIAARKQRSTAGAQRSREILETEGSRVKQKLLELKSRLNEDDLNVKIDKVHKWLSKGYFVNIVIKVAKNSTKKDAEAVKSKIDSAALTWKAEDADILGVKNSKLIITIK